MTSTVPKSYFTSDILDSRQLHKNVIYHDSVNAKMYTFSIYDIEKAFQSIPFDQKVFKSSTRCDEIAQIYNLGNTKGCLAGIFCTEINGVLLYTETIENPIITKVYLNFAEKNLAIKNTKLSVKTVDICFPYNNFVIIFSHGLALPIMIQSGIEISYDLVNKEYLIDFITMNKGN